MLMEKIMISKAIHFSDSSARYFWLFQGSSSVIGVGNTERWKDGVSKLFTDPYERQAWNQSVNVKKRVEPHLKNRDCSENWEMNLVCWGLRKTPEKFTCSGLWKKDMWFPHEEPSVLDWDILVSGSFKYAISSKA